MSEKSIEDKVKDIIVEQLGVNPEQVTPNASFIEDLGADSLDTVELVMAFEEEFSVEVPDEDAEKLQTVGDVIRYIEERAKWRVVRLRRSRAPGAAWMHRYFFQHGGFPHRVFRFSGGGFFTECANWTANPIRAIFVLDAN